MSKMDRGWTPDATDLDWIEATGGPVHPVLVEMEAAAAPTGIPILDRDSGRVLAALAAGRRRAVEIGTAIGYSTLWTALAMPADGHIVTVDPDERRTGRAREFWRRAGVPEERIEVVSGRALEAFDAGEPRLAGPFDLAFLDAIKEEYEAYVERLRPRLSAGALVLADNVLWSGRTSGSRPAPPGDSSEALRDFCARMSADPAFETAILPIGDGLLVATFRG